MLACLSRRIQVGAAPIGRATGPLPELAMGCGSRPPGGGQTWARSSKVERPTLNRLVPVRFRTGPPLLTPLTPMLAGTSTFNRACGSSILPGGTTYPRVAQPGRAPALGAGSRRFKSYYADHLLVHPWNSGTFAALSRRRRGFKSRWVYQSRWPQMFRKHVALLPRTAGFDSRGASHLRTWS